METPVAEGIVLAGRYRLDRQLGRGGMAEVYDGRDLRLDRPVAVKVLRPELAVDAGLRQRFEREAQAAARLSHPNVVAVYDVGEDTGRAFIVMERLGGETMADVVARGPLDMVWLRRLAADVLAALGAAHSAGIIHRDIKPANVLIGADGRGKVADFGIARVIEDRGSADFERALTATGTVIGTPAYLAPERAMGRPATPQSDIYSVGVVLYEALTGRKPFEGSTPLAVAAAASQGPSAAADPSALRPDADPELVDAVARAMAPDPAQRFPTAAAMAAAVRGAAGHATAVMAAPDLAPGPVAGNPTVPAAGPAGRGRRYRAVAVAAAVMVLAALVIAAMAAPGGSRAANRPQTTPATTATSATSTGPQAPQPTAPSSPAADTVVPTNGPGPNGLIGSLLGLAGQLGPADGSGYRQLITGLDRIAALPPVAQPGAGAALLIQATNWNRQGKLSDAALGQAVALLTPLSQQPPSATTDPAKHGGGGGKGGD